MPIVQMCEGHAWSFELILIVNFSYCFFDKYAGCVNLHTDKY